MEKELDLLHCWEVLKKRWVMIMVLPIIAALISGIVSLYVLKPVYEASTTLIVGMKVSDATSQQAGQLLDYNVLMANQQLAKTYGTIAKSRTVEENVIMELNLFLTPEQLDLKVSVNPIKNTEILEIVVKDNDPELASDIANMTALKFSDAVVQIKKIDSVSIVDKAVAPLSPIKPNKFLNILTALVAGFMVSIGLAFLVEFLDKTVKSSKDIEDILGLPVLGMIPHYDPNKA